MEIKVLQTILNFIPYNSTILDAGCGQFQYAEHINSIPGNLLICMDIVNPDSINLSDYNYINGNVECLPFHDHTFDFIYCLSVIQLIKDDSHVLQEFYRVLRPKGRILLTIPTGNSIFKIIRELEIKCGVYKYPDYNVKHHHYYTRRNIPNLIDGNFKILYLNGIIYNFLPRFTSLVKSLILKFMTYFKLARILKKIKPGTSLNKRGNKLEKSFIESPITGRLAIKNDYSTKIGNRLNFISDFSYHYIVVLEKQ
jgi:ubiquinone/menaquinone biosynthesis C-methylase UbiE